MTWKCQWCGKEQETRIGKPPDWIVWNTGTEILLCSTGCLNETAQELRTGKDN
jgi:hypothetical protein